MSSRSPRKTEIESVADRLHSAAIHLLRRLRRVDEASGLAGPRLSALSVLVFGGPMSLKALAAAEQVKPPSMSRLVAELSAAGLVRCEADASDGRAILITASSKGRRVLIKGRTRRLEMLGEWLAGISPAELHTLSAGVASLESLIRRHPK